MNNIIIYICGPTIYQKDMHLGNLRSLIWGDTIRNCLEYNSIDKVYLYMNFTDIDDKIIQQVNSPFEYWEFIKSTKLSTLNLLSKYQIINANDQILSAIDHIPEIIDIIDQLNKQGDILITDNEILFNSQKLKSSNNLNLREIKYIDRNSTEDYVLWKKDSLIYWLTPWMAGRPGWHIECVSMIANILKQHNTQILDYQLGGLDLKFPHHFNCNHLLNKLNLKMNKILHFGLLKVNSNNKLIKMSKSLANHYLLENYDPKVIRFFFLSTGYSKDQIINLNILQEYIQKYDLFKIKLNSLKINNDIILFQKIEILIKNFKIPQFLGLIFKQIVDKQQAINICYKLKLI